MTARRRRLHWLDALVIATAVLGIAGGAVSYRRLRHSQPVVDALEPATIRPASAARVRLHGRELRSFLQVFLVKAGVPLVLRDHTSGYESATYFLVNPRQAEIEAPPLGSGVYDVYLYDQGLRLAMLPAALRVQGDARPPATLRATVRFFVLPEIASMIHVGDRDGGSAPQLGVNDVAELREMTQLRRPAATVDLRELQRSIFTGAMVDGSVIDARLAVPVTRGDDGRWAYKGAPVRAGEDFTFETGRYVMSGITLDVDGPE
jgi:hypothetical protein